MGREFCYTLYIYIYNIHIIFMLNCFFHLKSLKSIFLTKGHLCKAKNQRDYLYKSKIMLLLIDKNQSLINFDKKASSSISRELKM